MQQTLKSKSVKAAILRVVASLVALVGATVVMAMVWGADKLITGPVDLATLGEHEMEGQYVYYDVELVLDIYVATVDDKDNYISYEYMALAPDGEHFMGILLYKRDAEKYEPEFLDMLYGYSDGTYSDENPASLRLTGTIQPMDSQSSRFFVQTLNEYDMTKDDGILYYLEANRLDGTSPWVFYGVWAAVVLLLLYNLFVLVRAFAGSAMAPVRKYAESVGDAEATMQRLETWFPNAIVLDKRLYMGPEVFIVQRGAKIVVINLANVVWAYKYTFTSRGVTYYYVKLGMLDGKYEQIQMKEDAVDEALRFVRDNLGWIATGYTDELNRLFKQDPTVLRSTAAQQRAGVAAAGQATVPDGTPQDAAPTA